MFIELLVLYLSIISPNLIVCRTIICLILKGELLESTTVGDMAHKPAYFVPGNFFSSFILRLPMFTRIHAMQCSHSTYKTLFILPDDYNWASYAR